MTTNWNVFDAANCPTCGADKRHATSGGVAILSAQPCRTPSGKPTRPHKARVRAAAQMKAERRHAVGPSESEGHDDSVMELLGKLLEGLGGRRTGLLLAAGYITVTVTPAGKEAYFKWRER